MEWLWTYSPLSCEMWTKENSGHSETFNEILLDWLSKLGAIYIFISFYDFEKLDF